jgi:hypothetical protein
MGQLRTSELLAALSVALDLTEGQRTVYAKISVRAQASPLRVTFAVTSVPPPSTRS